MISDLNSFIEFMAAIYVTMSIDNLIAKRFWTRDYESMLGSLFIKWRVPYISSLKSDEKNDIEDLQKAEELLSRRRGVLLLSLCVFLLVYSGFEPNTKEMLVEERAFSYISLDIVYLYVLCAFVFDRRFLFSSLTVLISILGIPFIFFLGESLKIYFSFDYIPIRGVYYISQAAVFTVFVLLFPVLWQLIRSWLYSHKNMVRIQYLVKKELNSLKDAQNYTNAIDINTIAEWYRNDAVQKVSITGTEDTVDGNMIQTFNNRLREIIKIPRVREILPYISKSPLEALSSTDAPIYYSESVATSFDSLCEKYYKMSNQPTIIDFANVNKVNHKEFKEYYSKWIIRNSKR